MIGFALVISFVGAAISYFQIKQQVKTSHQSHIEQIEDSVQTSLQSIEKVYYFFDQDTNTRMKTNLHYLLEKYKDDPDVMSWDYEKLKELFKMDVYVLNNDNLVIKTSFEKDLGLDFQACCPKFSETLDERRLSGKFYADGIDISQNTGKIKKFSYQGTHDKKYLFELGYSLEDDDIFQQFNFLNAIDELVTKYKSIQDIHVINPGGFFFGEHVSNMKLTEDRKKAFDKALQTGKRIEIKNKLNGEQVKYRYVPYVSEYDKGTTKRKVIEISYNEYQLQEVLDKNNKFFLFQLIAIILVTTFIASIISRWVSQPMYLAYHDSLTGLKNRAAYEEFVSETLHHLDENNGMFAFLILDIDNFKSINDKHGHDIGDEKLRKTARILKKFAQEKDEIFRLGGDEFVIIIPSTTITETKKRAQKLIEQINNSFQSDDQNEDIPLSISIGIAFAPEHGEDSNELYKKADVALYTAKEKGKNQYTIYAGSE